MQAQITAF